MNALAEFHFLRPLWWLAVLPLLALVWQWQRRATRSNVLRRICDPDLLPFVSIHNPLQTRAPRILPLLLASFLAIAALAGPTVQRLPQPLFREESALVIALDLSASMQAQDVAPTRLSRAKFKIHDLLAARDRGQTALVVFAGRAFPVTPLTDDVRTIESQLDVMEPALMPSPGSDVAGAIAACAALLTQAGSLGIITSSTTRSGKRWRNMLSDCRYWASARSAARLSPAARVTLSKTKLGLSL